MLDFLKNFFDAGSRVKVPTILQMEAVECCVNRDGSNTENILKAAENLGCVAKGFVGRPVALRKKAKNNFPLILFWEFNHFVVLEGIKGDSVYLNDRAKIFARKDIAITFLKRLLINSLRINGRFYSS